MLDIAHIEGVVMVWSQLLAILETLITEDW